MNEGVISNTPSVSESIQVIQVSQLIQPLLQKKLGQHVKRTK